MHKYTQLPEEGFLVFHTDEVKEKRLVAEADKYRADLRKSQQAFTDRATARAAKLAAQSAPVVVAPVPAPKKARKKAELPLDTLEVKPPQETSSETWQKLRLQCRETGFLLSERGTIAKPLYSASRKIKNCSLWGVFHSVSPTQNYKVGSSLCKSRLCPNCQRVVATKRKNNFYEWFEINRPALKKYFFYHMVLTVRHSAADGVRNHLYTSDLIQYFASLRGTSKNLSGSAQREGAEFWKSYVAGGSYSVEIKPGRDSSPHIHIHCLLVGNRQLWNAAKDSVFLAGVKSRWSAITGDSDNVFIERVYKVNAQTKEKEYCFKGSDSQIDAAVSECMKYTLKADAASLASYSNEFLTDLLTFKNRYYSRFGCLSAKDKTSKQFTDLEMLNTDYKDLEEMSRAELARLFDAETGEVIPIEKTWLLVTPVRNMRGVDNPARAARDAAGNLLDIPKGAPRPSDETIYTLAPPAGANGGQLLWFPPHERASCALALARTVTAEYDASLDSPN